jgi:hypothetical protein
LAFASVSVRRAPAESADRSLPKRWTLFALTAAVMIALGLGTATAVRLTPWDKR